eukprot:TRINITY_DN11275_c0_g2_i1.p1 TRINITY_DN11275_c0_g2~~TRINITY_DN11275_c0_g2_i1.p1  ORF type:complete len:556 (-),score=166.69 TRINITY_DN11275_c0_g2_i1:146-1813(-)
MSILSSIDISTDEDDNYIPSSPISIKPSSPSPLLTASSSLFSSSPDGFSLGSSFFEKTYINKKSKNKKSNNNSNNNNEEEDFGEESNKNKVKGKVKNKNVFWTSGRPPWFTPNEGSVREAYVIGITGGTSSGKTTVCHKICKQLGVPWAVLLSQDSFYKDLKGKDLEKAHNCDYNFDHPNAFDYEAMIQILRDLKSGKGVEVPIYDFTTHKRRPSSQKVYGADVILFEGILAFYNKELLDLFDLKLFVDADSDIRLARRLRRDIAERGRDIEGVLTQYERFVKPAFDEFIAPTKRFADIIIPNLTDSSVAINIITQHIKSELRQRGIKVERQSLIDIHSNIPLSKCIHLLPETTQIRGIHTSIRDVNCERDDFIFLSTRLTRLLVEYALSFLPFEEHLVITPTGATYNGTVSNSIVCGVSIMRAGESMEIGLREVVMDAEIGKILIQSNPVTHAPELIYSKLPSDIQNRHILLLDPMIGTGATAMMAIRILLDHNVKQENIYFLTLIAAPSGIKHLAYCFPKLKLFTSAVDDEVNENLFILPGIGNYGDIYFGTE